MTTDGKAPEESSGDNINANMGDNAKHVNVGKDIRTTHIESHGQIGGITGIVNIGSQQRKISQAMADQLVTVLLKHPPEEYDTLSPWNDIEALQLTAFIEQTLGRAGWRRLNDKQKHSSDLPRGIVFQSPTREVKPSHYIFLQWMDAAKMSNYAEWTPNSDKIMIIVGTNPD